MNGVTNLTVDSSCTTTSTAAVSANAAVSNTNEEQKQPLLQWKTKKRSRKQRDDNNIAIQNVLQSEESIIQNKNGNGSSDGTSTSVVVGPLIIPVAPDQIKWKPKQQQHQQHLVSLPASEDVPVDDDNVAIQALHDDIIRHDHSSLQLGTATRNTTIPSHANTFVSGGASTTTMTNKTASLSSLDNRDLQQYHKDIDALPSALEETAEEYQLVPIAEFGAALLRGMGWRDDTTSSANSQQHSMSKNEDIMPRPHRLGLGAIPAMLPEPSGQEGDGRHRRPRNVDQYQRDQRTQKHHDMYRIEREKKLAEDLQRTLQDGSIVHLVNQDTNDNTTSPKRARILKLVGVPGLNMVQVQLEHTGTSIAIKRNEIDGLVTREELDHHPFREAAITSDPNLDQTKTKTRQQSATATNEKNDSHRHHHQESSQSRTDKKRSRNDKYDEAIAISWVIPNIRVRIVTEKLGRRYYKEKGIVVDVTRNAGVTLKLNNHNSSSSSNTNTTTPAVVLDRIPERYLETALPKIGGNVIVVNPRHTNKYAKGQLIERDSKNKNYGIVQLYEDMDCIRLPLDDIAEWCGPLDDDVMP